MDTRKLPQLNRIYCSDTLAFLKTLPDDCIDMVMTSPPYWKLRDYNVSGQLGLETDLSEYLNKSLAIYQEIKRVLKPTGSFYLNIGDTYSDSANKLLPTKSLCGIPWRVALGMIDQQSWILRNAIIWHKPNATPSSVKDRLNNVHEFVFHFVKSKKYYYNLDAIRVPYKTVTAKRYKYSVSPFGFDGKVKMTGTIKGNVKANHIKPNPLGKNPGDVLSINTRSFKDAHFATYPEKLCELPIKSSCPPDGIVLDPFCGSGTTCLMAKKLGRNYIGVDLNPEYCEMARERVDN